MKIGSLFDGIGGWPYAAEKAGGTALWASEIEPFPQEVTKVHFPKMQHLGDITKINGAEIEPVDVITLGSPCQDLSVAGKREGLDGARSGLFKTAINIVRQMRIATNGKYPRFIVWENVPGAFSSNKGADFRTVLEEITATEIPMPNSGKWAPAGVVRGNSCEVAWRVLDAQYWGVPQRRKRIFLVADFGGQCATEILFKPEGMPGYPTESRGDGQGTAGRLADSLGKSSEPVTFSVGNLVRGADAEPNNNGKCKTLRADMGDQHPCICLNDQGGQSINVDYNVSPTLRSESHGNHPCIIHTELSPTLSTMDSVNKPAVAIWDMTHADEVIRPVKDGIVPTLNARMGTGGNQVPVVQEPIYCIQGNTIDRNSKQNGTGICEGVTHTLTSADRHAVAYSIQGSMIGRTDKNGPQGNGINKNVSFTLNTIDRHAVCAVDCRNHCESKVSTTLQSKNQGGYSLNYINPVRIDYKVRRITPTECERLQGLPDGYTLIDDKKCSDSARYKALGNGMAQPCPDFVMAGIARVLREGTKQMTANGMELNVCRVSFRGNKEMLYDYFNKWKIVKPGDEVVVTGKNGLSLGRVEEIVPFAKRNKLCSEVVVQPVSPQVVDSVRHECLYGAKQLADQELDDLLS